jgi:pilus assembly protein CpaB
MILRAVLFAVMAVGLLGFGLVVWAATRQPPDPGLAQRTRPVQVLVASRPVRPGALLEPADLAAKVVATADAPPGASTDTPAIRRGLIGAMVRRPLAPGDVIVPRDVMRPGEHGFLAAVLAPHMRAVTVGVDLVSGTAGLIWPGDRVDLILTQTIDDRSVPPGRRVAAETILADVRVIAIDQHLVEGAAPGQPTGNAARTVTLEVSEQQGERVAVATRLGRLSLAVRAADGVDRPGGPAATVAAPAIWAADVSHALAAEVVPGRPDTVRVFQGSGDGKEFRF